MVENRVIPTLFALDKESFEIKFVDISFSKSIHIDFMDGKFTKKKSTKIDDMSIVKEKNFVFEIHLMAYKPEKYLKKIKNLGIKRVYIHYEVFKTDEELIKCINLFKVEDLEVGIVLNPDTAPLKIFDFVDVIDCVLIMSVWPGAEGQEFLKGALEKARELRENFSNLEICMDGGIRDNNFEEVLDSGVNTFFVGSYVSSCKNPKENFNKLVSKFD